MRNQHWRERIKSIERLGNALELDEAMHALWRGTSDLMCVVDMETWKFLEVNPTFIKVLGWTREELCAKPLWDFIHPDDLKKSRTQAETIPINHTQGHSFQNRLRAKDGHYVKLEWYATIYGPVKTYCAARVLGVTGNGNGAIH